jgi:hypothetical protein
MFFMGHKGDKLAYRTNNTPISDKHVFINSKL